LEHAGHRQRMFEKLKEGKLTESETLEVLLFNAIPRRNTCDIAHRLLGEFGDLVGVLSASVDELQKVDGVGKSVAAYLACIGKFAKDYGAEFSDHRLRVTDREQFWRFLRREYPRLSVEVLDVFLIDGDGYVIYKHRFTENASSSVAVDPSRFTKLLVDFAPTGVVCVHNHPKGDATPSQIDEDATQKMQLICGVNNVYFCDHIICASTGIYSYYLSGNLKTISDKLDGILWKE